MLQALTQYVNWETWFFKNGLTGDEKFMKICIPTGTYRNELTIENGILIKGDRIIISKLPQPEMIQKSTL